MRQYLLGMLVICLSFITFYSIILDHYSVYAFIVYLLLQIIVFSVCFFFNNEYVNYGGVALIIFVSFFQPYFIFAYPIMLSIFYPNLKDYQTNRRKIVITLIALLLILINLYSISNLFSALYYTQLLFISIVDTVLYFINEGYSNNKLLAHELHDSKTEITNLMATKNKALMERQDNEIYMATLKERNRIAREIHDNVGHLLTRSILQVGALKVITEEETVKEGLNEVGDTLSDAMNRIRNSVHDLHDESIDLQLSINDLIKSTTDIQISLDYDISSNIRKEIKYSFLSIINEALQNTRKHSDATKMSIVLREHPALYQLLIEDNGSNKGEIVESGIGLDNMKDRVATLGGTIHIQNVNGFHIFISVMKENK